MQIGEKRDWMCAILTATDYSRPIQPLFDGPMQVGSVHSVFRRAMNITFGDTLLSILSDTLPRMPNSVRLPASQIERLLWRMRPGMAAFVGASPCGCPGFLSIPACDVFISLPSTAAWEPRPQLAAYQWDCEVVTYHVRTLAHYLQRMVCEQEASWIPCGRHAQKSAPNRHEGLAALVCPLLLHTSTQLNAVARKALPMLRLLMQATGARNRAAVERAACGLLGLGPGLTPSGDDVLAGFISVMVLLSSRLSVDEQSYEDVALWIAALAPSRTTQLSATLLHYAAHGEVAESLGDVLIALASPVEAAEAVMQAARGLLQFGATSGGDTLLGVLLGLKMLLPFATYADTVYNVPDSG